MRVQSKLILLLFVVVATFIGGLLLLRQIERRNFEKIAQERAEQRVAAFDEFLEYEGSSLAMLANDYTYWDDMVAALDRNDRSWVSRTIGLGNLAEYKANALWIYRPNLSVFHSLNNLPADNIAEVPIPNSAFRTLFTGQNLCHFFVELPQGVMEIRGATIHPSSDSARATPPRGYLFAGRLWSNWNLSEMERFTGNEVSLLPPDQPVEETMDRDIRGEISFVRTLPAWDGTPLKKMLVQNRMPIIDQLRSSSDRQFRWLIAFALALLLLLSAALMAWVRKPLRQISESLNSEDLRAIDTLRADNSEFGEITRLIFRFFDQRAHLIAEMAERQTTEDALRASEEQLRHSQKMEAIGRLAAGVAHDFNNLLTAIIGYSDLLARRLRENPELLQHAEMIQKAGAQAAGVTRQLLAFGRKQLLQPKIIDVNALILDMEKLLHRLIGEHIDLQCFTHAECSRVQADPHQLQQVIMNLGVNARDAMPGGGTMTIRTANIEVEEFSTRMGTELPGGKYITISVTDTGEGMDAETRSRIFEPFFTTKGPGKGTGLGLATVYGIVKQSGGTLSVESTPGRGSTFRLFLPLAQGELSVEPESVKPVERSRRGETVLVVEDEEIVRQLVCQVLKDLGYTVLCASRASEALQIAEEYEDEIKLIITDVVMPQMSGIELVRELDRKKHPMRVLYVSGYSDEDISDRGVVAGEVDFLQKPFTPQMLAERVSEALGERAAGKDRASWLGF